MIIDIQGFNIEKNKFIPKELAAYDGNKVCHYIFRSPFSMNLLEPEFHKQATWLTNNHHGISWNEGYTPCYKIQKILNSLADCTNKIYVKGKEKANYIRQYVTKPVMEFEEKPNLKQSEPKCFYHINSHCMCSLSNVYFLYENFIKNE